jgi:hypothetical protein
VILPPLVFPGVNGCHGKAREAHLQERLSTVDLLVLTSLDHLLLKLKISYLFAKQANLMRRYTVLSLPLQLVFPGTVHSLITTNCKLRNSEALSDLALQT